jgi:protein TonB
VRPVKRIRADIRRHSVLLSEIGLVLSLLVLIALFRAPVYIDTEFTLPETGQIILKLDEIEQTRHTEKAPPPPRPQVPIQVANDALLEDEALDIDAEVDLAEPAEIPLPPPPPPPVVEEEEVEAEIFIVVEQMPEIIGGTERLYELLEYPDLAIKAGIEGLVVVQFVVERDGSVSDVAVMRSANDILDRAAVEAVKQLKFTPGLQRDKPVRVRFALPVRFRFRNT